MIVADCLLFDTIRHEIDDKYCEILLKYFVNNSKIRDIRRRNKGRMFYDEYLAKNTRDGWRSNYESFYLKTKSFPYLINKPSSSIVAIITEEMKQCKIEF